MASMVVNPIGHAYYPDNKEMTVNRRVLIRERIVPECPVLKVDTIDRRRTFLNRGLVHFSTFEMGVRPYDHDRDAHLVKMLVGQGVMEGLTTANKNCR